MEVTTALYNNSKSNHDIFEHTFKSSDAADLTFSEQLIIKRPEVDARRELDFSKKSSYKQLWAFLKRAYIFIAKLEKDIRHLHSRELLTLSKTQEKAEIASLEKDIRNPSTERRFLMPACRKRERRILKDSGIEIRRYQNEVKTWLKAASTHPAVVEPESSNKYERKLAKRKIGTIRKEDLSTKIHKAAKLHSQKAKGAADSPSIAKRQTRTLDFTTIDFSSLDETALNRQYSPTNSAGQSTAAFVNNLIDEAKETNTQDGYSLLRDQHTLKVALEALTLETEASGFQEIMKKLHDYLNPKRHKLTYAKGSSVHRTVYRLLKEN